MFNARNKHNEVMHKLESITESIQSQVYCHMQNDRNYFIEFNTVEQLNSTTFLFTSSEPLQKVGLYAAHL